MIDWLYRKINGCICKRYCGAGVHDTTIVSCETKLKKARRELAEVLKLFTSYT